MERVISDQAFNLDGNGNVDPNDKCIPRFFYQAKHMEGKSKEAGHPIFEQDVMVEIIIPGAKSPVTRKLVDADKDRWPMQWFKFTKMGESKPEGTPVEQWPALTVMQVALLKSLNVLSIESLADLDDMHISKLGPDGRNLREKAKLYLKSSKDSAFVEKLNTRINELEAQVRELQGKPVLKKRGRPAKVKADA